MPKASNVETKLEKLANKHEKYMAMFWRLTIPFFPPNPAADNTYKGGNA
jgi:hypothetical protein